MKSRISITEVEQHFRKYQGRFYLFDFWRLCFIEIYPNKTLTPTTREMGQILKILCDKKKMEKIRRGRHMLYRML